MSANTATATPPLTEERDEFTRIVESDRELDPVVAHIVAQAPALSDEKRRKLATILAG